MLKVMILENPELFVITAINLEVLLFLFEYFLHIENTFFSLCFTAKSCLFCKLEAFHKQTVAIPI